MIRRAESTDWAGIARICKRMLAPTADPIDDSYYKQLAIKLILADACFVSEKDGKIVGVISADIHHTPWYGAVLQESVWFSEDNTGGLLLRRLIEEAKRLKADRVSLTVLESAGEKTMRFVAKLAGDPVERNFLMKV